jgi:signal transduction histidine kinase
MDPDMFQRAMQRGYSTKSGGGAGHQGLGLALVAQIVNRRGGALSADVTYGSVVTVTIP